MKNENFPMLAIETTGPYASVALALKDGKTDEISTKEKLNHLKGLVPLMDELIKRNNLEVRDIKTIAVSHGPGSFTGIRIGISTVRGIAQVTLAKVISVPTLESFVFNEGFNDTIICPIFDARRDQMYTGAFIKKDGEIKELVSGGAYYPKDFLDQLRDKLRKSEKKALRFYGDGIKVFEEVILDTLGQEFNVTFAEEEHRYQKASSVLQMALLLGDEVREYKEILPVYMRQAEAQRKLDEAKENR